MAGDARHSSRSLGIRPGGASAPIPEFVEPEREEEVDAKAAAHASRREWFRSIGEVFGILLVAVIVSVIIKTFLLQAFYVPSGSMETTLNSGDRIFVNRLASDPQDIERGDIIVFFDPNDWLGGAATANPDTSRVRKGVSKALETVGVLPASSGDHLVKRVIGKGGDTVACCTADGLLTINGVAITETYLDAGTAPSQIPFEVQVPAGQLWVMGDNRGNSRDSRQHHLEEGNGFVPESRVVGRAWAVFYPLSQAHLLESGRDVFVNVPDPSASAAALPSRVTTLPATSQ